MNAPTRPALSVEAALARTLLPASASPSEPSAPYPQGAWLTPRYQVLREVGRGGMGVVLQVLDTWRKRPVAMKLLHPRLSLDAFEEIRRELSIQESLSHEGILRTYDLGRLDDGERWFFTMEYVEAPSLHDVFQTSLERGLIPLVPFAWLADRVDVICEALHYAHQKGVIHRDLKPSNLLLPKDSLVKILDFGIASRFSEPQTSSSLGTLLYLAPEQIVKPRPFSPAHDLYALGAILYLALSGQPPLGRLRGPFESLSRKGFIPDFPDTLDPVLLRSLEPDPSDRFESVAAFHLAWKDALLSHRKSSLDKARVASSFAGLPSSFFPSAPETLSSQDAIELKPSPSNPASPVILPFRSLLEDKPHRPGETLTLPFLPGLRFSWCPEGHLRFGASDDCPASWLPMLSNAKPQQIVKIHRGFWIAQTPVTQATFRALMGYEPSHLASDDHPVVSVTWHEAIAFCNRLAQALDLPPLASLDGEKAQTSSRLLLPIQGSFGQRYNNLATVRLPSEAEWEYVARVRSETPRYAALFRDPTQPRPVGQDTPNPWGVSDLLGNVWEWCMDAYVPSFEAEPSLQEEASPLSPRSIRGNSNLPLSLRIPSAPGNPLFSPESAVHPAFRSSQNPSKGSNLLGFRVVIGSPS